MDQFDFSYVQDVETRMVALRLLGYFVNAEFAVSRRKSDTVPSVELRDDTGDYLFAIARARGHLNVYLRGPAARRAPALIDDAERAFADIARRNPTGETILRIKTDEEGQRLIEWFDRVLPWPQG